MTSLIVVVLLTVSVLEPDRVTVPPLSVRGLMIPPVVVPLKVAAALLANMIGLARVTATLADKVLLALTVNVPLPREPSLPTTTVAPFSVTPVALLLTLDRFKVWGPLNVSDPAPVMLPSSEVKPVLLSVIVSA